MVLDLQCTLINAENLFLFFDTPLPEQFETLSETDWQSHSSSRFRNKPLQKALRLRDEILFTNPDLILMTEVGGEESLRNFNQYFLNQEYYVALIEGNSDRAIDVGFLIHKRLNVHFNILSNKDLLINFWYRHERNNDQQPSHKFSRDVAELHLFQSDSSKPFCIFLLTHLKSPLDPEGIDPMGVERREAELKALVGIYLKLQQKHSHIPIIVCGDFNGNATKTNTDLEFQDLYALTDLEDIFDTLETPSSERITFYPMKNGTLHPGKQIDFVFLSKPARAIASEAHVHRYEIPTRQRPLGPITSEERFRLPSDHYPITFKLSRIKVTV